MRLETFLDVAYCLRGLHVSLTGHVVIESKSFQNVQLTYNLHPFTLLLQRFYSSSPLKWISFDNRSLRDRRFTSNGSVYGHFSGIPLAHKSNQFDSKNESTFILLKLCQFFVSNTYTKSNSRNCACFRIKMRLRLPSYFFI
jgi:hypothetical protein